MIVGPVIVLSLDFELRWGVADRLAGDFSRYRRHLEGVREAVPALLDLFAGIRTPATWATVGAVACDDWDDYLSSAPPPPRYLDARLVHDLPAYRNGDPSGRLHFAPDLVRMIAGAPKQELGSHSFSHMFFREAGVMRRDVDADARAVRQLFEGRFGVTPTSFVFPRNQVEFVDVLARHGIDVVRDNPPTWYHRKTAESEESALIRALRLVEALAPVGSRAYASGRGRQHASYFMRVNLPPVAFRAHRRRIAADARQMRADDVLHLWAHPHNFGAEPRSTIARLRELLDAVRTSRPGARFAMMREFAPGAGPTKHDAESSAARLPVAV